MSWYGSCLWDLLSPSMIKIEGCYNKSVKLMANLPYATQRSLIEHITDSDHIRKILIRRFLKFISKLKESKKPILRSLLTETTRSVRSVTGRNIRGIMLETGTFNFDELTPDIVSMLEYFPVKDDDTWKVEMLTDLLSELEHDNLDEEDRLWIEYICTD